MSKINLLPSFVGQKVIDQVGKCGIIYDVEYEDNFPIKVEFVDGSVKSYNHHGYEYTVTKDCYIKFVTDSTEISDDIKSLLLKHDISSEELISILLQEYH